MICKKQIAFSRQCVLSLAFLSIAFVLEGNAGNIIKNDFIQKSTKAWDELFSIYKKKGVSMSFQWQRSYDKGVPHVHSRVCILGNYQLNESEAPDSHKKYIRAANDRYSFEISKEQNANWVIRNVVNNPEGMINVDNNLNVLSVTPYIYQALIVQDCWLKDIVTSDSFVIKSIDESDGDQNRISVDFSVDYKISPEQTLTSGTLVLDKKQFWIVRHSKVTLVETISDKPVEYLITVDKEYKNIDGIPFPSTITTTLVSQNTATSRAAMQKIDRYDDPNVGGISKREFYLSHYGLSEPESPTRRGNTIRMILVVAGLLLIAFGLYSRHKVSKA